jgi:hypothetical protein
MANGRLSELIGEDFQIGGPQSESAIVSSLDQINNNNKYDVFIEDYFKANTEFKNNGADVPRSVKIRMIDILQDYALDIKKFVPAEHNDFFSMAYAEAIKSSKGGTDPIDALRSNSSVSEWDFSFDTGIEDGDTAIIPENIKAAGALYNLYLLGDQLHIFALTDAVILKWWNGEIDVPKGVLSNKMYRYYKLRSERNTAEDRGMLYKRIFDVGDGKQMDGVMVNEDFTSLWTNLLSEVTRYIDKREDKISNEDVISKQPIYRAIREIQDNLTSSMTGIASISTSEIYANYLECKFILGHPDMINQVTRGRTRNINEVIKTLSAEQFQEIPNVNAYFKNAETIQNLFEFIASFNGVGVSSEDFEDFVTLVDDYILNMELIDKKKNTDSSDTKKDSEVDDDYDTDPAKSDKDFEEF